MAYYAIDEGLLQQVEILQSILKNIGAGQFGGSHSSKVFGSSCDFTDFKEYMAGDDITKIDWNAYARTDKLYIKKFVDERQGHTRIYIDASKSMDYGKGEKAIQALKLAATYAYLSICEMDKVSLYAIKGNTIQEIALGMLGKEAFYNSIGKLNEIEFDGDCYMSDAILPTRVGYADGMSIIISDFLTDNNFTNAIDYLVDKKRDILCIQTLTTDELKPLVRGKYLFHDSEAMHNEDFSYKKNINMNVIDAYNDALEYIQSRIRDYCNARGANYLLVDAEKPVQEIFLETLSEMGVLK